MRWGNAEAREEIVRTELSKKRRGPPLDDEEAMRLWRWTELAGSGDEGNGDTGSSVLQTEDVVPEPLVVPEPSPAPAAAALPELGFSTPVKEAREAPPLPPQAPPVLSEFASKLAEEKAGLERSLRGGGDRESLKDFFFEITHLGLCLV